MSTSNSNLDDLDGLDVHPATVSLAEVAQEAWEQSAQVAEEVDKILGGDPGDKCTYDRGYLPRQAVFSCLTCTPDENAGVCTACALQCHDGHTVVEIWTRRHFRCDCGNSKFGTGICKLTADKEILNEENVYNHNFKGTYCTCVRPYPDPVREEQGLAEDMMQCCICEDWFHKEHLGLGADEQLPSTGDSDEDSDAPYEDLICNNCVTKTCPFITSYGKYMAKLSTALDGKSGGNDLLTPSQETMVNTSSKDGIIGVVHAKNGGQEVKEENGSLMDVDAEKGGQEVKEENGSLMDVTEGLEKRIEKKVSEGTCLSRKEDVQTTELMEANGSYGDCFLLANKLEAETSARGPVFMVHGWRDALCRCASCLSMYKLYSVEFLLKEDDTIAHYEAQSKRTPASTIETAEAALLSQLDHTHQIELQLAYSHMATQFKDFLRGLRTDEVVTEAHVVSFFEDLHKKRRL